MLKVLIIENDPIYRKNLVDILAFFTQDIEYLGYTDSIKTSIDWFINNPPPDLLFLSTDLPDGSGLNLFKEIGISSPLIIMSNDEKWAFSSFKYLTLDYLIRPISKNGIISCIYKYKKFREILSDPSDRLIENNSINFPEEGHFVPAVSIQTKFPPIRKRFAVQVGDKIKPIDIHEIAYFRADGNIVYLMVSNSDEYIINYTLEDIFEKLDPERFFRLNRTFIVQITSIQETRKFFNGRLKIFLKPTPLDEEIFVSRNRVNDFLKWLGE